MGIEDFFGKLFSNIGRFARKSMVGNDQSGQGRTGFGIQRPNPYMSDAPESGNWGAPGQPYSLGDGGNGQNGGMLEMLMKSRGRTPQQQNFPTGQAAPPTDNTDAVYTQGPSTYSSGQPSPADALFARIQDIQGRDYSKKKDPNTGQVTYGKDYDKTHNWKDILRGIGLGALQGGQSIDPRRGGYAQLGGILGGALGGGVGTGVDRNLDNKMLDELKLKNMLPQYEQAYGIEQQRKADALKQQMGETQIANINEDNARQQQELARKQLADSNRAKYWTGILANNKAKIDLSTAQLDDLKEYRKFLIDNGTKQTDARLKQIDETIRHNEVTEKQAVTNEQGRNTRSANRIQASADRAQNALILKQKMADYQDAIKKGQIDKAAQLKKEYLDMKAQKEAELLNPQQ